MLAGFALLLAGWVLATPPTAGFDEQAHLVRALAAAEGQWTGAPPPAARRDDLGQSLRRVFVLPGRWSPEATAPCLGGNERPEFARCIRRALETAPGGKARYVSQVGLYGPAAYLPAGLAAGATDDGPTAYLAGRAATSLVALALLAVALAVIRCGTELLAVVAATTPSVLFICATITTSGIAVAAGLLTAVSAVSLARGRGGRGSWAALGLGAAVLMLARPLGPLHLALTLAAAGLLAGRTLPAQLRRCPGGAALAGVAIAAAGAAALAWTFVVVLPRLAAPAAAAASSRETTLLPDPLLVPTLLAQSLGAFAWGGDQFPSPAVYALLAVPLVALFVWGLRSAEPRGRALLGGAALGALLLGVLLDRLLGAPLGYAGPTARYLMPSWVLVPVLAAAVARHVGWTRRTVALLAVSVGLGHAAALTAHVRQYDALPWSSSDTGPLLLAAAGGGVLALGLVRALLREEGAGVTGAPLLRQVPRRRLASRC